MDKLKHTVLLLFLFILTFGGLFFASPFLIPLVLAAVFSMLFIRLCNFMERKGIGRNYAAFYCLLMFIGCIGIIITLLTFQLGSMAENFDAMKERLSNMLETFKNWINDTMGIEKATQDKMISESSGENSGGMMLTFASDLISILVNSVLLLVYMYLFLCYRSHIKKFILKLAPKKEGENTEEVIHEIGKVAQKYLSGLGAMIAILWVMYGIGFSVVGVEGAIFFAVLCGLLEIIPFVGNLTGTSITVLATLGQGGDSKMVIGVLATYFLVQFIQTYILEPLIVGEQVNINPLFTIMAIVLGEMVWGIAGMILAVPLLGMIKIICDNYPILQPYGFLIGPENPRKKKTGVIDKLNQWFSKKP
ncbi:MAG: AI-2E family transporter [Pedobacter sp.]|nr:MAG: AI-2E family transporter [Pedobacter sp.]